MEFRDYYEILSVPRDASADDIRKSFRKLARKYHPDVSRDKDAEARMKEVNEAYAVLSDPEKHAACDQLGKGYQPGQDFQPPPDWDAGFELSGHGYTPNEAAGFSDFFEQIFGRAGMGGGFSRTYTHHGTGRAQGEDHHTKVLLDLEDAFTGAPRQITLRAPELDAQGRGTLVSRTLYVKIPKGVKPGQIIRLAGQGAPGTGGGAAGDLLPEVQFKPYPRFRAEGRDV